MFGCNASPPDIRATDQPVGFWATLLPSELNLIVCHGTSSVVVSFQVSSHRQSYEVPQPEELEANFHTIPVPQSNEGAHLPFVQ